MKRIVTRPVALMAAVAAAAWSQAALAQENNESDQCAPAPYQALPQPGQRGQGAVMAPMIPARRVVTVEETVPNASLIGSGLLMFGLSYGGSVIVAGASDRPADTNLFVPVAGPWMDLVNRGQCTSGECLNETANKVLLAADGVIQGVGALQILAGFLFPETRITTRAAKNEPSFHVAPTAGLHSVGLTASGSF